LLLVVGCCCWFLLFKWFVLVWCLLQILLFKFFSFLVEKKLVIKPATSSPSHSQLLSLDIHSTYQQA
jgi:hypothetical protein